MNASIDNTTEELHFPTLLKQATATAHANLEQLPISSSIMKPDVTMAEYSRYLQVMYQVINEVEKRFFHVVSSVFSDMNLRAKSDLIKEDLKKIGGIPEAKSSLIFDSADKSTAFIVGIIYVVEGSTLGGRYMLKNINSVIDFGGQNATTFLDGYGNTTGSMWKKFANELSEFEAVTKSSSDIIAGAQHAFEAIHNHFLTSLVKL